MLSSPARAYHDKEKKKNKIRPNCYLSFPLFALFPLHFAVASAAMKWFLSAVHLFPPSSSSLFRVAARVSLQGAGLMGPMGGTEKFRLGAGSQVVYMMPVHLLFYLSYLIARLSAHSTLICNVFDFSSSHSLSLSLSLYLFTAIYLSFSTKKLMNKQPLKPASFMCVQTALTGTRVTYRSWHTRATWLSSRHHASYVYIQGI